MKDYFKNLNTITDGIKRKIYRKKDVRFVIIMEKWNSIVGERFYLKSNPLKITREHNLKVEVSSDILIDFKFSSNIILDKVNNILDNKENIIKILVVQKNLK